MGFLSACPSPTTSNAVTRIHDEALTTVVRDQRADRAADIE
jgi:hypothetical protein